MKTFVVSVIIVLSILSSVSYADEVSKKVIAEDLLITMKSDQMIKPFFNQIRSMMEQQFVQMGAPEAMRPILKKYTDKIFNLMEETLNWQALKEDIVSVYIQTFTEDELKGMLAFYKSPVGKSVIDKMPIAVQYSVGIVQKHMPQIQVKLKEIVQEMKCEIEKMKSQQRGSLGEEKQKMAEGKEQLAMGKQPSVSKANKIKREG